MRQPNRVHASCFAAIAVSALSGSAFAQEHEGDIILLVEDGKMITTDWLYAPLCTFGTTLDDGLTNDPGFDSPENEFPANSDVGFTILQALREWDGTGFDTIPVERIEMSWGPIGPIVSPLDDTPVEGFTLNTGSNGEFHYHYKFELSSPAEPGVYLLAIQMWVDDPSIEPTDPAYLLLAEGVDDTVLGEALDWWSANGAWCSADACEADFNDDGAVNTVDVLAFLNAWSAGDSSADISGDGTVNTQDVLQFLNLWAAGC